MKVKLTQEQIERNELISKVVIILNDRDVFFEKAKTVMSSKEYKQFETNISSLEKATADFKLSLMDSVSALQSNVNARKKVKIDPYIAGGAAQGIAGVGAGVCAAVDTANRNENIDNARRETQKEVYRTNSVLSSSERVFKDALQKVLDCIMQYEVLKSYFELALSAKKKEDEWKKQLEKKSKQAFWIIAIVYVIVAVIIGIIFDSALLGMLISVPVSLAGTWCVASGVEFLKKLSTKLEGIDETERVRKAKKLKRIGIVVAIVVCLSIVGTLVTNEVIIPNSKYKEAVALMDAGKYEEAYEAFIAMDGYKDSTELAVKINTEIIPNATYENAMTLIEDGNYEDAYEKLISLEGYKDSAKKADSIYPMYFAEKYSNVKVGDYVTFGSYEQDNNVANGKEPIEWKVLEKKENRLFVISKFAIDCLPYHDTPEDITWQKCNLRMWLNNDFFDKAFSNKEKIMISSVSVSADKNPYYNTNSGITTKDKIFLLSVKEAEVYLDSNLVEAGTPTDYTESKGTYVSCGSCMVWLRTSGEYQDEAACITTRGGIAKGAGVTDDEIGVRPAMWIEFN